VKNVAAFKWSFHLSSFAPSFEVEQPLVFIDRSYSQTENTCLKSALQAGWIKAETQWVREALGYEAGKSPLFLSPRQFN